MSADLSALRARLAPPRPDPPVPGGVPAAVMVPVIEGTRLLFTKRTQLVRDHKGEISFPGGVRHDEDPDLLTTALRETEEELGIPPTAFDVLGALPPTPTIATGYVIVPFVGLLEERPTMTPSAIEIAEVLEFDLSRLRAAEREVEGAALGSRHPLVYVYEVDGRVVWGATGRVLHDFLRLLEEG